MDSHRAIKALTEEIIDQFRLPRNICYNFIYRRIEWALGIGFDLGRAQTAGRKPVLKQTAMGVPVKAYSSVSEAANVEGVDKTAISKACRGRTNALIKGHYWKFLDPQDFYKRIPVK